MSMAERNMPLHESGMDDLPRTLRREREARERGGQSTSTGTASLAAPAFVPEPTLADTGMPQPAVVTAFDVPFLRLVMFFMKAVFAMIPALLVLGAILWTIGHLLMTYYPWLVKVQILIRVPN